MVERGLVLVRQVGAKAGKRLRHQGLGNGQVLYGDFPQGGGGGGGQVFQVAHQRAADGHEFGVARIPVAITRNDLKIAKPGCDVANEVFKLTFHPVAHHDATRHTRDSKCIELVVSKIGTLPGLDSVEQLTCGDGGGRCGNCWRVVQPVQNIIFFF